MKTSLRQWQRSPGLKAGMVVTATLPLLWVGNVFGGPQTTFTGSANGVFTNPNGGVTSGVGTNAFAFGVGDPSTLEFTGNNFSVTTPTGYIYGFTAQASRPTFSLGTLNYRNGTIEDGTGSDSVRLDVAVKLHAPVATSSKVVPSTLMLINTLNTDDPAASADQVFLPKSLPPVVVTSSGGAPISIEPVGFVNASSGGFTSTIDRFSVFETAFASADLVAKVASPCEPIVRNAVKTTINGKTMEASFTPQFFLTLTQAANLCGYDHFNWYQVITTDPFPPGGQAVPYTDPPVGGGTAFGGCADDLPFYWDERSCPPSAYDLLNNISGNTLSYSDTPAEPSLGSGQFLAFTTSLVGVNADNTYEILYTFSWKSNNTGSSGNVFRRTHREDSDLGGQGGVFDVRKDLNPWEVPVNVRKLWAASGARNADNGLNLRISGDVNADGRVDCHDLTAIRAAFGSQQGQAKFLAAADLDSNGTIDARDLAIAARALPAGTTCN